MNRLQDLLCWLVGVREEAEPEVRRMLIQDGFNISQPRSLEPALGSYMLFDKEGIQVKYDPAADRITSISRY